MRPNRWHGVLLAAVAGGSLMLGFARPLHAEPDGGEVFSLSSWLARLAAREEIVVHGAERLGNAGLPKALPLEVVALPQALIGFNYVVSHDDDGGVQSLYILARLPAAEVERRIDRANAGTLAPPLASMEVSSEFGMRKDPFTGRPARHSGVDLAAPEGTPVLAAADGRVAEVGRGGRLGLFVRLDHGGGRQTLYAHLRAVAPGLEAGVSVSAGQRIGAVGRSGRATAAHLHFELRLGGRAVKPVFNGASGPDRSLASRTPE